MRMSELGGRLPILRDLKRLQVDVATLRAERVQDHLDRLLARERYREPGRLARHEAQVFSQGGEDGAIAEIFRRIGVDARTFVEIGVGDGLENNTSFLLWQGWSGWWVEGNEAYATAIRGSFRRPLDEGQLRLIEAFVRSDGIGDLFAHHGLPEECDLFSLDIDRNTYWTWAALRRFRPRVAVVEYNASVPPRSTGRWRIVRTGRGTAACISGRASRPWNCWAATWATPWSGAASPGGTRTSCGTISPAIASRNRSPRRITTSLRATSWPGGSDIPPPSPTTDLPPGGQRVGSNRAASRRKLWSRYSRVMTSVISPAVAKRS